MRFRKHLLLWIGKVVYWFAWPICLVVLQGSARTRGLVVYRGSCLLTKGYVGSGQWCLPGGGLHRGEDPREGACRELAEEVGLMVSPHDLIVLSVAPTRSQGLTYTGHYFGVEIEHAPNLKLQPHEIAEAKWVAFEQVSAETVALNVPYAIHCWVKHKTG